MRKLTYSDIDSSSSSDLKHGTIYLNNDQASLRVRVVNADYNENYNHYIEFLPSVLDSNILDSDNDDFTIRLGDRRLRFAELEGDDNILSLSSSYSEDKIVAHVNIAFDNQNNGIKFSNGDVMTRNPVKWTLLAGRNYTDTVVPLYTSGYSTVETLFNNMTEIMVVARVDESNFVSTVIPIIAVPSLPATFIVYKEGVNVGSVTFNALGDANYTITSNADSVTVFAR